MSQPQVYAQPYAAPQGHAYGHAPAYAPGHGHPYPHPPAPHAGWPQPSPTDIALATVIEVRRPIRAEPLTAMAKRTLLNLAIAAVLFISLLIVVASTSLISTLMDTEVATPTPTRRERSLGRSP